MALARVFLATLLLFVGCHAATSPSDSSAPGNAPDGGDPGGGGGGGPDLLVPTYALTVPALGPGFTDLTADLEAATAFHYKPPSPQDLAWTADIIAGEFGDVDGDGLPELILSHLYAARPETAEIYKYDGKGHLTRWRPDLLPAGTSVVAIVDLDGDNNPDILLGQPSQQVLWGLGGGAFSAPQNLDGGNLPPNAPASIYFDDIDRDGWLDVLGANSCCGAGECATVHPFLRTGARQFTDPGGPGGQGGLIEQGKGVNIYTVFSADFHEGEKVIGTFGVECPGGRGDPFYVQKGLDAHGYPHFVVMDPTPADTPTSPSLRYGGPPMGGAIADIDGDGLFDLAMSLQSEHFVFLGQPSWPFQNITAVTGYWRLPSDRGNDMIPWSTAFVDIDADGRPDAINVHGGDDGAWLQTDKARQIGLEEVRVHWNGGKARFADMSQATHLDRRGQWMTLAVGDLDNDGDPDLIVGGQVEMARVYRNDVQAGDHQLSLRLYGTSSNRLAIGARVDVTVPGQPVQHHVVQPNFSRFIVSEPVLFIGLGAATSASAHIVWPSGVEQDVAGLTAGSLTRVQEPPLFTIDPPDRSAPADGKSFVTLTVTPRNPDGSVRAAAKVGAALASGVGKLSAPVAGPRGWTVRLDGPAASGYSLVEISVDGKATPLRPRINWR